MVTKAERIAELKEKLLFYTDEHRCATDWLEQGKWRKAMRQTQEELDELLKP